MARSHPYKKIIYLLVPIILILAPFSIKAAAVTWDGPNGGTWETPTYWSIDQVPGPDDDVTITGALTVNLNSTIRKGVQYTLNDNVDNTIINDSIGISNGTFSQNTDLKSVSGKINSALDFNGTSDYINIDDTTDFSWSNALTLSAWFKTSDSSQQRTIIGKAGSSTTYEFNLNIETDGRIRCWVSSNGSAISGLVFSPTHNYADGNWHHTACVYNGANIRVYVDGVAGTPVNFTGNVYNGTSALRIGHVQTSGISWFWNGALDDVRVYGLPLTDANIQSIYNSGNGSEDVAFPLISRSDSVKSLTLGNGTNATTLNFNYDAIDQGPLTINQGDLTINTGSTITHASQSGLNILGRINFNIPNGSANILGNINVDGRGYSGGTGYGVGPGAGGGSCGRGSKGAGGAHGGYAGGGTYGSAAPYGSPTEPITLGSGAGGGESWGCRWGGTGGGAVKLFASEDININGIVTSNGTNGQNPSGGGAGGSIWLSTGASITGTGTIRANGGSTNESPGGGGSGGRISLTYKTQNTLINTPTVAGGWVSGGVGTLNIKGLPSTPLQLQQNKSDGFTSFPVAGTLNEKDMSFEITMSDGDNDILYPMVEVKPIGEEFSNIPSHVGSGFEYSGSPIQGKVFAYSSDWQDSAWLKRKQIIIHNKSNNALTNYALKVRIESEDEMNSDYSDLRFFNIDNSPVNYWVENINTEFVDVWLQVNVGTNTSENIYMYYGNSEAVTTSNNSGFFLSNNQFNGTTIDTNSFAFGGGGTITQDEEVTITNNGDAWDAYFTSKTPNPRINNLSFQSRIKTDVGTRAMIGWHDAGTGASYTDLVYSIYFDNGALKVYEDGTHRSAAVGSYTQGIWHDIRIDLKPLGATYYYKESNSNSWILFYDSVHSSETNLKVGVAHHDVTEKTYIDDWILKMEVPATIDIHTSTTQTPDKADLMLGENYHWQAKVCDSSYYCSDWTSFGENTEIDPDFTVDDINQAPDIPTNLGNNGMITGGYAFKQPTLEFELTDPDLYDSIRYKIQIATNSDYSNIVIDFLSSPNPSGLNTFTLGSSSGEYIIGEESTLLTGGDYYWRVKAVDYLGLESDFENATINDEVAFVVDPSSASDITGLTSTTHTISTWNLDNDVTMTWDLPIDTESGLDGYSYHFDTNPTAEADTVKDLENATTVTVEDVFDGDDVYFHIRTVDTVGNWGTTAHFGPLYIDEVPPTIVTNIASATHPISVWKNNNDVTLTWTAPYDQGSEVDGYSIELDNAPTTTPNDTVDIDSVTTTTFTDVADGIWYLHIKPIDNVGHIGEVEHYGPIQIDTVNPINITNLTSSTHTVDVWSKINNLTYTWTASTDERSGLLGYSYILDSNPTTAVDNTTEIGIVNTLSFTARPTNIYYLHIKSIDIAGNISEVQHIGPIKIDITLPTTPSTPTTLTPTTDTTPTWSWNASTDAHSGLANPIYELRWCTNTGYTGCTTNVATLSTNSFTHDIPLEDNTWYFSVRAVDNVSNYSAYSGNGTIIVDTTGPTGTILINGTATSTNNRDVTLTLTGVDGRIANEMIISENSDFSGANYEPFSISKNFTLSEGYGNKTLYVKFKDNLGNVSTDTYSDSIYLNDTPNSLDSLTQLSGDGTTEISVGGGVKRRDLNFKFTGLDNDTNDKLLPQIEISPIGNSFINSPTHTGVYIPNNPSPAELNILNGWYSPEWNYRQEITLNNTMSTSINDYQLKYTLNHLTGMQNDFDDIRFTDNGIEVPYWLENKTEGVNAVVWLKVSIPSNSSKNIYMYYGNATATSESNGNNVFDFFDGFDGNVIDLNKWNIIDGTGVTVANGQLTATSTTGWLESKAKFSRNNNPILETKSTHTTMPTNGYTTLSTWLSTTDVWGSLVHPGSPVNLHYRNNGTWVSMNASATVSTFITRLNINSNNTADIYYYDYNTGNTINSSLNIANTIESEPIRFIRRVDNSYAGQTMNASWDWIRSRKKIITEPTITNGGIEEKSTVNINSIFTNWVNNDWSKRKIIEIQNSSPNNLTDYTSMLEVTFDEGMQSDFDDLRFFDGQKEIPYFLETKTDSVVANVWIKFDIAANSNKKLQMYYANQNASSRSNKTDVFEYYEGFDGTTIDTTKYTSGGGLTVQNNELQLVNNANAWDTYFFSNTTFSRKEGKSFQARLRTDVALNNMIGWHDSGNGGTYGDLVHAFHFSGTNLYIYEDNSSRGLHGVYPANVLYDLRIDLKTAGASYYIKQASQQEWTLIYESGYSSETNLKIGAVHYDATQKTYTDNWKVVNIAPASQGLSEFEEKFNGDSINTEKFVTSGGTTVQRDQIIIKNDTDVWDLHFTGTQTYTRNKDKTFQARIKADSGVNTMIGWHDSGSGVSYTDLVYAMYFKNTQLHVYEDGTSRGQMNSYVANQWYDVRIVLKQTGAFYYYKTIDSTNWIPVYNSTYSTESNLKPSLVQSTANNLQTYTDDWQIFTVDRSVPNINMSATEENTSDTYHWQARSCDLNASCSDWVQYGNNSESEIDFSIVANDVPEVTNLGPSEFTTGLFTNNITPTFNFDLSDVNVEDEVKYNIQVANSEDFSELLIDYTSEYGPLGQRSFTVGQDINNGIYTTGASGQSLSTGDYYWRVKVIDSDLTESTFNIANNGDIAFTIDVTAPSIFTPFTISPTSNTTPTWQWEPSIDLDSGLNDSPYTVRWCQDANYTDCELNTITTDTNEFTHVSQLTNGTWYFSVKSKDALENESDYSSNAEVFIDLTAPTAISIVNSPTHVVSSWSNLTDFIVNWSESTDEDSGIKGYSFLFNSELNSIPDSEIEVDSAVNTANFNNLMDGSYYFHIIAIDNSGNTGEVVHVGPYLIDTDMPTNVSNITSPTHTINTWSTNTDLTLEWNFPEELVSGLNGYSFVIDSTPDSEADNVKDIESVSTLTVNDLNSGIHFFHIRALDNAGNWGDTEHFGPIKIDTTTPSVPEEFSVTSPTNNNKPVLSWGASQDLESGLDATPYTLEWCTNNNFTGCTENTVTLNTTSYTSDSELIDSTWYFRIKSTNTAGSSSEYVFTQITIDSTPPGTVADLASSSHTIEEWSNKSILSLNWVQATDNTAVSGYSYILDENTNTIPTDSQNLSNVSSLDIVDLTSGIKYFHIKAKDIDGNWGETVHFGPIQIDITAPEGSIAITRTSDTSRNATLILSATDNITVNGILMIISENSTFNNSTYEPFISSKSFTLSNGVGNKVIYIKYKDLVGNESTVYTTSTILAEELINVERPTENTTQPEQVDSQDQSSSTNESTPNIQEEEVSEPITDQQKDSSDKPTLVKFIVRDSNNNPISGALVKIIVNGVEQVAITDENGLVEFSNLNEGEYIIVIEDNGIRTEKVVDILGVNDTQNISIGEVKGEAANHVNGDNILIATIVLIITSVVLKVIIKRKHIR